MQKSTDALFQIICTCMFIYRKSFGCAYRQLGISGICFATLDFWPKRFCLSFGLQLAPKTICCTLNILLSLIFLTFVFDSFSFRGFCFISIYFLHQSLFVLHFRLFEFYFNVFQTKVFSVVFFFVYFFLLLAFAHLIAACWVYLLLDWLRLVLSGWKAASQINLCLVIVKKK